MKDNNLKDRLRERSREFIQKWENEFLQPDPETYLYKLLNTSHTAESASAKLDNILQGLFFNDRGDVTANYPEDNLRAEAKRLLAETQSMPDYERLLDRLSLPERPDLARIATRLSAHGIHLDISRDSLIAKHQNGVCYIWKVLCNDGNVSTIGICGMSKMRPFAISHYGPVVYSMFDAILWELYSFLVIVVEDGRKWCPDSASLGGNE